MTETLWNARYEDYTPAKVAGVYRHAAQLISQDGYSPYGATGSGLREFSVEGAIRAAALSTHGNPIAGEDLAEEATARFASFLLMAGQMTDRTSIRDLADLVTIWETNRFRIYAQMTRRHHSQAEAMGFLTAAAAVVEALPDGPALPLTVES